VEFAPVLIFVGLLVFLSHLFVALFERTRVPDVLYLTLIGIIIGPVLHIVSPLDFGKVGHVFTTIALVVILFEGGLELSFEELRVALRGTLVVTLVSYGIAFVFLAIAAMNLLQLPVMLSLFVAAVVAAPAPAIVIPLVRQLKLHPSTKAMLTLESPLGEALGIIVALAILESIKYETIQIGFLVGRLVSSFTFALVIGAAGGFAWSMLLHRIRQLRFAIFTTPSFIILLFGLTEFLGFSGPVAALTFGVTLGNVGTREIPWLARKYNLTPMQHNETERAFFGEIVFLIKTFFFVYLGLSVQLTDFWTLSLAVAFTIILLISRILAVRLSSRKELTPLKDAAVMSIMIPKGTAAAVLAAIPVQMALEGSEQVQNQIYAIVVVSIVVTALLIFIADKGLSRRIFGLVFRGYKNEESENDSDERDPPEVLLPIR
jgi:Na+:H+ antiporter